jgi:hypothetical protein
MATARREPVSETLLRALQRGAHSFWQGPGRKSHVLHRLAGVRERDAHPGLVLEAVEAFPGHAPVLLVIDEFGKSLEFAAAQPEDGDLFLLQRIAELLAGAAPPTGALFSLQHLAFEDYLAGLSGSRRQE